MQIKFHLHKQCTPRKFLGYHFNTCILSLETNFSNFFLLQITNTDYIINTVVTDPTYIIVKSQFMTLSMFPYSIGFVLDHGSKNAGVQLVPWLWACLSVLSGILQQCLFHSVPGSTRRTKCNINLSLSRKNVVMMNFANVLQYSLF